MTAPTTIRRRRFRFSLKTLFLLLTIFSVVLGLVGVRLMRSLYQETAVQRIQASGGAVLYESLFRSQASEPNGPRWLRRLAGSCFLDDVAEVQLLNANVRRPLTDVDFYLVARLPKLRKLVLENCDLSQVSPEAFAAVARSTSLTALYAGYTNMTDAQLAALADNAKLQELDLERSKITDQSIARLRSMKSLKWLDLASASITDASIEDLKRLSELEEVWLAGTQMTDGAIRSLQAVVPRARLVHPAGDQPFGAKPYNPEISRNDR